LYIVFKNVSLYHTLPNGLWNNLERKNTLADPVHNVGYFAAVGTLLAILIIGALAIAGFRIPALRFPGFTNTGTLTIRIIDAPTELAHLNITIDSLSIQKSDGNETWINLDLIDGEPIYFDLLALQNVSLTLSRTEIPTGNYTKIRMHVLTANGTYTDGSTAALRVPSSKIDVHLKPHLIMESNAAIAITIDLVPTVNIANNPSLNLNGQMKAMVNE
jgi:hypothetical protein